MELYNKSHVKFLLKDPNRLEYFNSFSCDRSLNTTGICHYAANWSTEAWAEEFKARFPSLSEFVVVKHSQITVIETVT